MVTTLSNELFESFLFADVKETGSWRDSSASPAALPVRSSTSS
jgi:hypothetical protein